MEQMAFVIPSLARTDAKYLHDASRTMRSVMSHEPEIQKKIEKCALAWATSELRPARDCETASVVLLTNSNH